MDFWNIIDQARGTDESMTPSASPEALRAVLNGLDDKAVIAFGTEFTNQLCRLNRWRLWGAGYTIAEGMSDDSFHYFRSWLIGKGRKVVELALNDPDDLGPYIDDPDVDNEGLEYVAVEILEARESEIDPRDAAGDADAEPEGEPFNEETVSDEFPKLAKRFG